MLAVSCFSLGACGPNHKYLGGGEGHRVSPVNDTRLSWEKSEGTARFSAPAPANSEAMRFTIVNLHGAVHLRPSESGNLEIAVDALDGFAPRYLAFSENGGEPILWVLDDRDAVDTTKPEPPCFLAPLVTASAAPAPGIEYGETSGVVVYGAETNKVRVNRVNRWVPRVDVTVQVPTGAHVDVRACARLTTSQGVSATVRARCGSDALIAGASGHLDVETHYLEVTQSQMSVAAVVRHEAHFNGVAGDKHVRGTASVSIVAGQGHLDIDVPSRVFAETSISPGYQRSTHTEASGGGDEQRLKAVGPTSPPNEARREDRERRRTVSRVNAPDVELRIPLANAVEVFARVSDGPLLLWLPRDNGQIVPGIRLVESSGSSAQFTLGEAHGELRVTATRRAEIIVK